MTDDMEPSVDELVALALGIGDNDSDERWDPVRRLQRRGDRETFDVAARLCRSDDPAERTLGVDILGQLGAGELPFLEETLPILLELSGDDSNLDVLYSALCSLGHLYDARALETLLAHARHPDRDIRFAVAVSLPSAMVDDEPAGIEALMDLMADEDAEVRDWATTGLGSCVDADSEKIRDALARRLDDDGGDTAGEAMVGLGRRGDPRCFEPILAALTSGNVGNLIVEAAAELADPRFLPALQALADERWAEGDPRGEWLQTAIARCSQRPPLWVLRTSTTARSSSAGG